MNTLSNNIIINESGSAAQIENYKIVIIGDQHVGKTSILSKYKYETIEEGYFLNQFSEPYKWSNCYENCATCEFKGTINKMN